jgi:outer membrane protein assembly factor BamA
VGGNGMHLTSSINADNLFQPAGQLSYQIGIKRPYFFGIDDPKRSMLNFVFFNTRKLLKIPTANFGIEQPNLEYDRAGLNISLHENYSRNSRGSFSLVAESISCDPETNRIKDGPPNTISNSGSDKVFLLRGETVRDTTNLKRATILGARDLFTFDQGVGPSFYNRFMVTATRFIGLSKQTDCVKMPASLVLHGKYGNCIGDMALYNYFKLGGPFSCRGYKSGELGFARRFFEFALEIRCQLQKIDGQVVLRLEYLVIFCFLKRSKF